MLYPVPGDPKTGYDLGIGTGTYGGDVRWGRTVGTYAGYGYDAGMVRVRYGYTVRGYGP